MTNPTLTVEIGHLTGWTLGVVGKSELGTTTNLASLTYDNITSKVRSLSIRRGRNHELDRVEAGTASVRLLNQDGAFNPTNTTSTYYPNIRPMIPLRIKATFDIAPTIAGLVGWYDFSDKGSLFQDTSRTIPITANGQTIKGVIDKSGSGNHLSEATNGPAYTENILNGLSIARFDGVNDILDGTVAATSTSTIWLVVKGRSAPSGTQKRVFSRSPGVADLISFATTDGTNWVWVHNEALANQPVGIPVNAWHLISIHVPSTSSITFRAEGALGATFDPRDNITTGTNMRLGSSNAEPTDADLGEALLYNSSLSNSDTNKLGLDLASKWGFVWTNI